MDGAAGAKAKAAELGADLKLVNLGNDANKTVGEVQSAIARTSNDLVISAWNQDVTVCGDRVKAAEDAFDQAVPGRL
ncbi:hypothetical protein [Kitasatospora sp. NPDC087314]|uniref:hypothetical protein n=1 Tax=Kitasatospora sp. NPDC087314 TaxID=3364068 RepID=UPI0038148210